METATAAAPRVADIRAAAPAARPLKAMEVRIVGKVTAVRRHEAFTYTTVICPAADLYSRPSVVEIRSKQRFAEREEELSTVALLGGYQGRPYTVVDRESGERRSLTPVNLFLDHVE